MEFGIIQSSKVFNGASGKANLTIRVSGDKGEIRVATMLEKKDGEWQIIKAGYFDRKDNFIDITAPYTGNNILEVRRLNVPIRSIRMYCIAYSLS
jgi:predicted metalloprotease with PDZ domain